MEKMSGWAEAACAFAFRDSVSQAVSGTCLPTNGSADTGGICWSKGCASLNAPSQAVHT